MNQLHYGNSFAKPAIQAALFLDRKFIFSKFKCSVSVVKTGTQSLNRNYVTLIACLKRNYATEKVRKAIPKKFQKALLPFEIESSASSDVLLFSFHKRERVCLMITLCGIFLFCALVNSSELIYMTLSQLKSKPSSDEKHPWYYWWRYVNFNSKVVVYSASGFVFFFAFVVLGFALAYPTRMIREVRLLKGGEKVLLETYRPFGYKKSKELLLKDISAQWGPSEAKHYLPLKVRGKRIPLLLNQDGKYHDQKLFDQTVGLYRF